MIELLFYKFLPYWPLFVILTAFSVGLAILFSREVPPIYTTAASIIIRDERKGVETTSALESLNYYSSKQIVENEIEILRSKDILLRAINRYHLNALVSTKKLLASRAAFQTSPVMIELKTPDAVRNLIKGSFVVSASGREIQVAGTTYPVDKWLKTNGVEMRFVPNPYYSGDSQTAFEFALLPAATAVEALKNRLVIASANKLSTVIEIVLNDEVPLRAEKIVNSIIEEYNSDKLNTKKNLALNTLKLIQDRISGVEKSLDSIDGNVQSYRTARVAVNLDEQTKSYIQNMGETDKKLNELNMQLAVLDNLDSYIRDKDASTDLVPSLIPGNDNGVNTLLTRLVEAEVKYENLQKTTAVNSPLMLSLKNEIEKLRKVIADNVNTQRKSLKVAIGNLSKSNLSYKSYLENIPQQERDLLDVNRQRDTKQSLYDYLLQKREETTLSLASMENDKNIIDHARSSVKPVFPKLSVFVVIGLLAGVLLSILSVLIKENTSKKILFTKDIERLTAVEVIAELPNFGKIKGESEPIRRRIIAEHFNALRQKVIKKLKADQKVLLITSSIAGEGKSFVCANLARSFSKTGRNVCIVDFDLYAPKLTEMFSLTGQKGLSEYYRTDSPAAIIDCIHSGAAPNLYVIPVGANPGDLIDNLKDAAMYELFAFLKKRFDLVIVDTPPTLPVADALSLADRSDLNLFITRHGATPKNALRKFDEEAAANLYSQPFIVFNGVESRGVLQKWSGYGYGYGYTLQKTGMYGAYTRV